MHDAQVWAHTQGSSNRVYELGYSPHLFEDLKEANSEVQEWRVVGFLKDFGYQWVSECARPSRVLVSLGLKFRILGSLLPNNSFFFEAVLPVQNCSLQELKSIFLGDSIPINAVLGLFA